MLRISGKRGGGGLLRYVQAKHRIARRGVGHGLHGIVDSASPTRAQQDTPYKACGSALRGRDALVRVGAHKLVNRGERESCDGS